MHTRRQTVLLTGFGPFPGVPTNASTEVIGRLAGSGDPRLAGYQIAPAILPTEWRAGPARLVELLKELRPMLALHFGVTSRAEGFQIETRGRNRREKTKDACGEEPGSDCVDEHGPDHLPTTIPAVHAVSRLRKRGLPAQLSRDAGTYICNALLYRSLYFARCHAPDMRAGFVHIPDSLLQRRGVGARRIRQIARLDLDGAVEGSLEIVAASLGRPSLAPKRRPVAESVWDD
jgi:pyroglutamyl-peptidase